MSRPPRARRAPSVRRSLIALVVALALLAGACAGMEDGETADPVGTQPAAPPPTSIPTGSAAPDAVAALDEIASTPTSAPAAGAIERVEAAHDVRLAWLLVDLLRFHQGGPADQLLVDALVELTAVDVPPGHQAWVFYSDLLLVWDVPAPPDFLRWKRAIYTGADPSWAPFFADSASLDWRTVTWDGGGRENPAPLDDPEVVPATENGGWLPGDEIVYGIQIAGETRAYPRRVLQVHEVVNDTVGGRRIAVTYCSLSDAATGHYLDDVPEGVGTLRLSSTGLLDRSSRLVYDIGTDSLVDPIRGAVVGGPLAGEPVLAPLPVVVTTWDEWRAAHPESTVVSEDGGVGRVYVEEPVTDPADGPPSFPVGPRDERLAGADRVLAVDGLDGTPVAVPVDAALDALARGESVVVGGVEVELEAGGLIARDELTGQTLGSFEARWFAWSQVRPQTVVWAPS